MISKPKAKSQKPKACFEKSPQPSARATGYITLITVMIVGAIVSTAAVFLFVSGTGALKYSQGVEGGNSAKAAASACAELALAAIQSNPSLSTPTSGSSTLDSANNTGCSYTIIGNSPTLTISATGTVDQNTDFVRKLTITTSQLVPQIVISSWQETP